MIRRTIIYKINPIKPTNLSIIFRKSDSTQNSPPVMIQCTSDEKIVSVINKFLSKTGYFKNSFKYIFNGKAININSNKTIKELNITDKANIFYLDSKNSESNQLSSDEDSSEEINENETLNNKKSNLLKMNIIFTSSKSGSQCTLSVPKNETVRNLLNLYFLKMGISKEDGIFFLYNGQKLSFNDNRSLFEVFKEKKEILVIETQNVIGA